MPDRAELTQRIHALPRGAASAIARAVGISPRHLNTLMGAPPSRRERLLGAVAAQVRKLEREHNRRPAR